MLIPPLLRGLQWLELLGGLAAILVVSLTFLQPDLAAPLLTYTATASAVVAAIFWISVICALTSCQVPLVFRCLEVQP